MKLWIKGRGGVLGGRDMNAGQDWAWAMGSVCIWGGGGAGTREKEGVLNNWRGLTLARPGWRQIESLVKVAAAKDVPYYWPIFRAVQLSSEVYSRCGEGGLRCEVLYRRRTQNFQYPERAESLVFLSSLWLVLCIFYHTSCSISGSLWETTAFSNQTACPMSGKVCRPCKL